MKPTIKSQIVSTLTNIIKPSINTTESKKLYINNDGTVAENVNTYRQFKADLNNRNYGW